MATELVNPLVPLNDQRDLRKSFEKAPISYEEAVQVVMQEHKDDGVRKDMDIKLSEWAFGSSDGETMMLRHAKNGSRGKNGVTLGLRANGFQQLCTKVEAPASYILRLPQKIQRDCINHGIQAREGSEIKLRLAANEIRSVVTEKYGTIDDYFYMGLVKDVLEAAGVLDRAMVRGIFTGLHTIMRITIPSDVKQVGEPVEYGIDIGNSEVGLRRAEIIPITYILRCTNGMRSLSMGERTRKKHLGDSDTLKEDLMVLVPEALAEAQGSIVLWEKAQKILIKDALKEFEKMKAIGLTQSEINTVGATLADDNGWEGETIAERLKGERTSVFHVANAITATARQRENTKARLTLEEVGYKYLARAIKQAA